jgi:hypothetical protein
MKNYKLIIAISVFLVTNAYSKSIDPQDTVYKSWLYYKKASNEYNEGNYEQALDNAQKSLMFKPNKKSKKLVQQIREIGYNDVKTGVALINFNPELAKKYLTSSKALIEPKDKKTLAQIEDSLKSLEAVQ